MCGLRTELDHIKHGVKRCSCFLYSKFVSTCLLAAAPLLRGSVFLLHNVSFLCFSPPGRKDTPRM